MSVNEVRVIRWIARGYEDSFTQYTITPANEQDGRLHIVQIALRDNLARALQGPPTVQSGTLDQLRAVVDRLIANRCEDGAAVEVADVDAGVSDE